MKRQLFQHFRNVIALMVFILMFCIMQAQSPSIEIKRQGIVFPDRTEQTTSANSLFPGSNDLSFVVADFSNGINGNVTTPMYEDHVKILKVNHNIFKDLNSIGVPTSTQHHQSLIIQKDIDSASTDLYDFFNNNTTINSIEIKFIRPNNQMGFDQHFYSIVLSSIKIAEIKTEMNFDSNTVDFYPSETLSLIYQTIEFKNIINNTSTVLTYQY